MLCESCKKKNATFHYRFNENGNVTEAHLCADCAKNFGHLNDMNFSSDDMFSEKGIFGELFGTDGGLSLFNEKYFGTPTIKSRVCPACGLSDAELRKYGKLGCKKCYDTFGKTVEEMLSKLHLSSEYKGRVPGNIKDTLSVSRRIESLKAELQKAVEAQEYEEAARIRDSIKQLESFGKN